MSVYQPHRLDVDLFVDRTKVSQPEDIVLSKPSVIRIQTTNLFVIENYNPRDIYEIEFSIGTWTVNQGYITYIAPDEYFGPLKLTIKQTKAEFESCVLFEDGTVYTENAEIKQATKTSDGKWEFDYQYSDYDSDVNTYKVEDAPPPIPTTKKYDETINLGSFDPSKVFGDLGSYRLNSQLSTLKNGNVLDYFLPSERNKNPDERKYLYDVEGDKFLGIPRNSNVTESGGDIFKGYRKKGDVGGSLEVIKNDANLSKTAIYDLDIKLWDLEAVVPDEIISLCLTSIEFNPVLRGLDTGHTYLWEQISGDQTTVIWLTPKDQKDVVIDLGNLKVDRVFRFWISKGTEYEKHYDIYLYGTPFDRVLNAPHAGLGIGDCDAHLNIKVHECSPIVLTHTNIWNKQLRVNIVRNY